MLEIQIKKYYNIKQCIMLCSCKHVFQNGFMYSHLPSSEVNLSEMTERCQLAAPHTEPVLAGMCTVLHLYYIFTYIIK